MKVIRYEISTALVAIATFAALVAVLLYLGAPGLTRTMRRYQIYFEDAGGLQPGATVHLNGRKIGQVRRLISPVPKNERPRPDLLVIVEVEADPHARIYRDNKVLMLSYSLLGDEVIDFTAGDEASGLAEDWAKFIGERQPGLNDAAPLLLKKIDPVVTKTMQVMDELHKTATQLTALTAKESDLSQAIAHFKEAGGNLSEISAPGSPIRRAIAHFEDMTSEESPLAGALRNVQKLTGELAGNKDIAATLRNFHRASQKLNASASEIQNTICNIQPGVDETVHNTAQLTDTLKRQPWRLFWPSTKKYPEDQPQVAGRPGAGVLPVAEKVKRPLWATPAPAPATTTVTVVRERLPQKKPLPKAPAGDGKASSE